MPSFSFRMLFAIVIIVVAAAVAEARDKTDVMVLNNGDRVTCEIKSLSRGKLTVKTDAMGTIDVKWTEVVSIESQYYYRVVTSSGRRLYGSLDWQVGSDMLTVAGETSVAVEGLNVVEIVPLANNFWDRNDGSMSFGFSFSKGSDVTQLTFAWNNLYRTERNLMNLKSNAIITNKGEDSPTTTQANFSLTYYRLLNKAKWTGSVSGGVQRNDELGLKRRIIFGVGAGVNAIRSNRNSLLLSVGLALNSELGADTSSTVQSAEAVLSGSYSFFRYNSPKTDISTSIDVYPSITEKGRIRTNYDLKYSHELFSDFTVDLTFFINYDSEPPTAGAETTDWGIVLSFGWSY